MIFHFITSAILNPLSHHSGTECPHFLDYLPPFRFFFSEFHVTLGTICWTSVKIYDKWKGMRKIVTLLLAKQHFLGDTFLFGTRYFHGKKRENLSCESYRINFANITCFMSYLFSTS